MDKQLEFWFAIVFAIANKPESAYKSMCISCVKRKLMKNYS